MGEVLQVTGGALLVTGEQLQVMGEALISDLGTTEHELCYK